MNSSKFHHIQLLNLLNHFMSQIHLKHLIIMRVLCEEKVMEVYDSKITNFD